MIERAVPARFISLEGVDGSGKSTQARLLAKAIAAAGRPVLLTREPGGAPGAEVLRRFLLESVFAFDPLAEALLHFAARTEHVERTLRPALSAGLTVICDRFFDSTLAYQGYGQGADRAVIATLIRLLGLTPHLTFVLDVPPDLARSRLAARGTDANRYERLNGGFLARVCAGFRAIASHDPDRCILIDASPAPLSVHEELLAQALKCLSRPPRGFPGGVTDGRT
ncbi:MAG: dTMP kinase [Acetobacteraceae bacterium]